MELLSMYDLMSVSALLDVPDEVSDEIMPDIGEVAMILRMYRSAARMTSRSYEMSGWSKTDIELMWILLEAIMDAAEPNAE